MNGAAALLLGIFLFLGIPAEAVCAGTSWNFGYDYTTGSGGYSSDFLYGGINYSVNRKFAFSGNIGIFNDVNYDIVEYFFAQGRRRITGGMWLGGIFALAGGESAGGDSTTASGTFGILYRQELGGKVTAKLEYEHTNGSIRTAYNRQIITGTRRRKPGTVGGAADTSTVQTDTTMVKFDFDLSDVTDGLSADTELAFSNSSDKTKLVTETIGFSYPVREKIYLSADYARASDNFDRESDYLTFGIYLLF